MADSALRATSSQSVGRYELLAKIASGGMATVHLARGPNGELAAVKCVHPHLSEDRRFVEMFFDEAHIASRIDHPNVCRVIESGEHKGTYFLAMEYLHGVPLAELMLRWSEAPETRPERFALACARMMADAASGLHAAHELRDGVGRPLGVVH